MTVFEILILTLALLAVPAVAGRFNIDPAPAAIAAIWSVVFASLILLTMLVTCAAALLGSAASTSDGIQARHLIPAFPVSGWISVLILSFAFCSGSSALWKAMRRRRELEANLRYAPVALIDHIVVATLPTDDFLAAAVPGPNGSVVMSQGALRELSRPEIRAIVHHEESHRRHGHHRQMLLARTLERGFCFVPGMRSATRALRDSLERVADADARRIVGTASIGAALQMADSAGTAMRRDALGAEVGARSGLVALSLSLAILTGVAVLLEMTWLGIGT